MSSDIPSPESTRSLSIIPDSEPPDVPVLRLARTPGSFLSKSLPTPPDTRRSSRGSSTMHIKRKVADDSDLDSDDLDATPARPQTNRNNKQNIQEEDDRLPLKRREVRKSVGVIAKAAFTKNKGQAPIQPINISQTARPVRPLPKGTQELEDEPLSENEDDAPLEYADELEESNDELIMQPEDHVPFKSVKKTGRVSVKPCLSVKVEVNEDEDEILEVSSSRPARAAKATARGRVAKMEEDSDSDVPLSSRKAKARAPVKTSVSKGKGRAKITEYLSDDDEVIPATSDDDAVSDFQMDSDHHSDTETEHDRATEFAIKLSKNAASASTSFGSSSKSEASRRADAAESRLKSLASGSGPGYSIDTDAELAASLQIAEDTKPKVAIKGKAAAKAKTATKGKAKGKGKGKVKASPSSDLSDLPAGEADSDIEFQGVTSAPNAAKLAELQKEYIALLETSKTESSLDIKRRLARLVKSIGQIEQSSVLKQQAALKKKVGRKLTQGEKNQISLWEYHPELRNLWGDLESEIAIIKPVQIPPPPGLRLNLLPFQKESLYWMKEQEKGIWRGGMLADEMGMGKTIQTIALLLSDHKERDMPCMVVAPVVALKQWKSEIETHTDGLKVMIFHGATRAKSSAKGIEELKSYDVILTSFGTLQSGYTKQEKGFKRGSQMIKENSVLHQLKWWRIILDEAHNIKDRTTNVAKACFALDANYKWCLSGTPLQNRVGELYSLIRFLGGDPYSYYFCKKCPCKSLHWSFQDRRHCDECGHNPMQHVCLWNNEILNPIVKYGTTIGEGKHAWKKLKLLLDRMMLRRTKLERADDLGLPPRTLVVRRDFFSPEEKELYLSLFSDAKRQFTTYVDSGTVLNNYSNIFSLITRMRQLACHPDLVLRSKTAKYIEDLGETTICRLCNEVGEDVIMSKCSHCFDRECIRNFLLSYGETKAPCPVCNMTITIDLEAEPLEQDEEKIKRARQGILGRLDVEKWRSSTKVEALVEELSKLRAEDVTTKSLVFSQFVSFLDIIAFRLKRAGFKVCRLEGGMSMEARAATIDRFIESPDVTIFLISLKAGGVALNLTAASRVFMMDRWNPSIEYQAMDRIHRLGQHRPVICTKFAVEDSIESKIIQLQEKKLAMTEATLNPDASAMGKLTHEDLSFLFRM